MNTRTQRRAQIQNIQQLGNSIFKMLGVNKNTEHHDKMNFSSWLLPQKRHKYLLKISYDLVLKQ